MRSKLAFTLSGVLLCQAGCIVVANGHGLRVRSGPGVGLHGPRPSQQVVEELVRAECGNLSGLELRCSTPVRLRILDDAGRFLHGWWVTASIGARPGRGPLRVPLRIHVQQPRSYMIHKRKHGFAIVAHAEGHPAGAGPAALVWQPRDLVAIDRHLALVHSQQEMQRQLAEQRRKIAEQKQWIARQQERELERERKHDEELARERRRRERELQAEEAERQARRKLAERRREWEIMTRRPTPAERQAADYGPRPRHATEAVRVHLARMLKDTHGRLDIKVYQPSKTWGRVQGSAELVWGWSVRARVRIKKKGERPRTDFYRFMFRGEEIVSNRQVGLGYSLSAKPGR